MNPCPRIRKAVKWGGAAITLTLLVVWIASGWMNTSCALPRHGRVVLRDGRVSFYKPDPKVVWGGDVVSVTGRGVLIREQESDNFKWWVSSDTDSFGLRVAMPLWLPAAAWMFVTLAAWRPEIVARRRARAGRCRGCNYDRTGLAAETVCPECGVCATDPMP